MTASAMPNAPLVLVIRDGWGENPNAEHAPFNAIAQAHTPVDDQLRTQWPHTLMTTCGEAVGLPPGTMGNSEVGHQNIGAGRIVDQELMRITKAIDIGSFFHNQALIEAMQRPQATGGRVHLLGLLSDGKVHSTIEHLFALIDLAVQQQVPADRLLIHVITDGRDVGPCTALGYIDQLQAKLRETGIGHIASVIGRYYAMDRDHRWERTALAYHTLTGRGEMDAPMAIAASASEAVQRYYDQPSDANRASDEFVLPAIMADVPSPQIHDGDSVIFFNFRGDRPRQIVRAFMLDDAQWSQVQGGGFQRGKRLRDVHLCAMSRYEQGLPVSDVAFDKPPKLPSILGQVIADAGLTQFRCAETEKFAHVTFFFNDYREAPFTGESRVLIPSPQDVTTYDQRPEMSARGVCDAVLERLSQPDVPSLFVVNFANPDMVGHTGNLKAVVKAVETVDACVGRIVQATLQRGGSLIVTADHGNAEQMWNPATDVPHTAHTVYDVPLYVIGEAFRNRSLRDGGILGDIAPTALEMLKIPQPAAMTGRSLLDSP
jgi:2,3-bisphosphoglycerate-independent phosphoglycerate mutase